ncbi:MAG: pilus assembly protein N-terminal domain-containing protein [Zhengella sp.]|uniref:pilus assembly protein N-terminal domain-containing protein n=1 Tax=Zhengella sp. TaxID=2282762 RepID=UPI001D8DF210|nr:pilus assembly protein N-terminal domain-containing protein [Notoacmeibacter sp.]MCC0025612.1 pilus assembly protein N-terminal domain-containing protein [Brucellaceae bacterium]
MIRYIAFTAALAAGLAAGAAASATEAGIEVAMNQAKIIKLTRAADTVVVGEPKIADVTVKDSTTIVLTGKGFGVTNLVILDQEGAPIVDEQVYVRRSQQQSVRVYRRSQVQTLSCTPYCEAEFRNEAVMASDAAMAAAN